jgi:colanic acid/amylovoran biosynthesis glycosyltransferase
LNFEPEPVVAFYCATFLKPEMLHIYRQITALRAVQSFVITQKRENSKQFPFDHINVLTKPITHELRRFWFRKVRDEPWQISTREVRALTASLERANARLLHIFFGHIAVHLLPLIRKWRRPTVVSFHGADVQVEMEKPGYRCATEQMLTAVKLVLVRSESLRRAVIELGCAPEKIAVVRTGIPLEEFPFRERTFPPDGAWRFLQAGRLIEKKGLATSLRAFAKFAAHYPKATFTIAGAGPLLRELQGLARELKIDNHVRFTGFIFQEQLRELFYTSDIFLHPSETGRDGNQEGVPNSMLEAMATGLPLFATQHGGIPEVIESGVSGLLVPERDHDALAQALLAHVHDREGLARIGRDGSEAVAEKFNQQVQTHRLEEIYLQLM